jgi:RHS repeat-associated protein
VVVPSHDGETWSVSVAKSYTYTPFGGFYEGQCVENIDNPFKFTGQWHDAEIDQYYLRARMYDPTLMRFTARDPVVGQREDPLTLNPYLYCWNAPTIYIDPSGEYGVTDAIMAGYEMHANATYVTAVGVENNDWDLITIGTYLETLIQPAMAFAMVTGRRGGGIDGTDNVGNVIQNGGNKIKPGTARALGLDRHKLGRAVELLKGDRGLGNNYHGMITDNGAYLSRTKEFLNWILEFYE